MHHTPDRAIRVLVCDLPLMLRQVLELAVEVDPETEVVASVADPAQLAAAVARSRPDVVLVSLEGAALPPECVDLLDGPATAPIIGLDATDGRAYLFRRAPEGEPIGEVSPADVVAAIRELAGRTG